MSILRTVGFNVPNPGPTVANERGSNQGQRAKKATRTDNLIRQAACTAMRNRAPSAPSGSDQGSESGEVSGGRLGREIYPKLQPGTGNDIAASNLAPGGQSDLSDKLGLQVKSCYRLLSLFDACQRAQGAAAESPRSPHS